MTPGARVAAAIDILDAIAAGQAAEQALSRWARASRFAGSKDRAAIRDHVFDVLRHWRSDASRGGADTGRGRMIGRLRAQGIDPDALFDGQGHAPAPLSDAERGRGAPPSDQGAAWDLPDWLVAVFEDSLGAQAEEAAIALTRRAPVTVRVNISLTDIAGARASLAKDGIDTVQNPRADTALTITDGARRLRNSAAYRQGHVEIQDASSQAAVAALNGSGRALDLCAGGGGKALALAARGWFVTASDIDPKRMKDLPDRAARGQHRIDICPSDQLDGSAPFDLVFVDAPCSGAGTWRRTPEAKWALTPDRLAALCAMQRDVLTRAAPLVAPGGLLVYATCSILECENSKQLEWFAGRNSLFDVTAETHWAVDDWGDGFYSAHLTRMG
ncbi:RsmB/NOP family class I SAM-dependent RNA methyltransferase [Tateyamaria omphalii]|uniref:RsmB/NOP family class I SAM-dependent RNA methyltransferase n=1 Tax=Tateyamaria omphalii TaxID=299262 RepID=UPI001C999312|nr:RsmB/NOP family class I SAM-dependent RNA methyltransferase [Tateyamaria omphalii]MBY5932479.1 RsmB/NOP family class I SAM-dependent RNA methyltransferase [Tateyamaria omphalii]